MQLHIGVRWSLLWSENGDDPQPFGNSPDHIRVVGIYRDQSLIQELPSVIEALSALNQTVSSWDSLRIDNATVAPIAVVGQHPWDDFSTEISLAQSVMGSAWHHPLLVRSRS